jgi:hypothetical protein
MSTLSQKIYRIQKEYWTFNRKEKEILLAQFPHISKWKDILRLHHLLCMEIFQWYSANNLQDATYQSGQKKIPVQIQEAIVNLKNTTEKLLNEDSPYIPQACEIKYDILTKFREFKKLEGTCMNASLSHLGSLEVFKVDGELNPLCIDFIPFSEIKTIMHNADGTLISYKDNKEKDICYLASHYYFSKESTRYMESTISRYMCVQKKKCKLVGMYTEEARYYLTEYGLGYGPQEFMILHNEKSEKKAPIDRNAVITMLPHLYEMEQMKSTIDQSALMM